MKSFFLAFVALTLAVDAAIAIECYTCAYVNGADVEFDDVESDKSCKSGKKPNKKYNVDCGNLADSCLKIVVEEGDAEATIRTCWMKSVNELIGIESDTCIEKSGKDLADLIEAVSPGETVTVPDNAKATLCTCTSDKCNSSSMVRITQGSLMVLVIGFLTSKLMY